MIHKDWDINEEATGRTEDGKPIMGVTLQNGLNDIEPDGSFVPCDEGISEVTQGVTHLKMNRGRMGELRFGDSSHPNSFLVKIKNKALKGVSFKYTGADGESMTANNGKPLCNFDNGISIESTPYYKGVKMDIIVDDPLTAPLEYPFSVKTYGQDYVFVEENGGAILRGEDQDPVFIEPPFAEDANGDIGVVTIQYTGIVNNLITFKKVVDETWFRNAAAPVRIDPNVTITTPSSFDDTFIFAGIPNTNYGSATNIAISNFTTGEQTSLVRVDISPYAAYNLLNGEFRGNVVLTGGSTTYDAKAWSCLRDWIELQATWNIYKTANNWQTAGAEGALDRAATEESTFTLTPSIGSSVVIPITDITLNSWKTTNNGVILEHFGAPKGAIYNHVGSSENVTYPISFYMEYTEGFNPSWARNSNQIIGVSQ